MTAKDLLQPSTALYPVPVVLVSCKGEENTANIITIAWTGTACSDPPMLYISVRPDRFSHSLIQEAGEFVVNIPTREHLPAVKLCGTKSGKTTDKWEKTGFTKEDSSQLPAKTPLIKECPVNLECITRKVISLGSHDMFIGEIVAVHKVKDWRVNEKDALCFVTGAYHYLGRKL